MADASTTSSAPFVRPSQTTLIESSTPLFALARKNVPEVVVSGLFYYKQDGEFLESCDPNALIVARSLLKPWQFLAADVGGEESFWAIGLASHSGQLHQMAALKRLSEEAHVGENELFCPRDFPLDASISAAMRSEGKPAARMLHPCSGKHLLALAACRKHEFPIDGYWDADHPLQKRLMQIIGQQAAERSVWMTDSCGLPTVAMSGRAHCVLWEKIAQSDDPRIRKLRRLWLDNARLTGGFGRLDSDLMEAGAGQVLAKEGADGLLVLAALPKGDEQPLAVCFIKLASGYNSTQMALALWSILSRQKNLPDAFKAVLEHLRSRIEQWVPKDQNLILPPFI